MVQKIETEMGKIKKFGDFENHKSKSFENHDFENQNHFSKSF